LILLGERKKGKLNLGYEEEPFPELGLFGRGYKLDKIQVRPLLLSNVLP
jgi:hypothetical protein